MKTALLPLALASINLDLTPAFYYSNSAAKDIATNTISPYKNAFSSCSCDLTIGGCDANCCCDRDCETSAIKSWKIGGSCDDYTKYGATLTYEECIARYNQPWLDDLRGGLYIYEKIYRQLLCT